MQNNRWSAVSALPYGPGWGTNTPGGVASCMTWDATPRLTKWEPASGNYARPRTGSATIPAGAARYLLEPSLNYDDRQTFRDASADYPMNVYSANQFPPQTPQNCDDILRYGPRGPSRCGAQVHHYNEDLVVSTPVCCCSDRNQPRTARKCEACSYRRYQDGGRRTPKPPVKFVQFAPEETGRVIEIVEDVQGRPVTMAISRPTTPSQMMRNQRGHGTQQRQWARTYPHAANAEIVVAPGYVVADDNRNANDVRRLMNIYQAGKADANFHKGVSEKWRSAVVSAGPNGREEVLTETKEREKTVAVRRYQQMRYPTKQTIGNQSDQHYIHNEYEPHRNNLITRSNGMTVVQQRQPCVAHGWKDPIDGRVMRAWEADEAPQPPNRVKLQIECPANVDTVVNVRVRPDADYRFN